MFLGESREVQRLARRPLPCLLTPRHAAHAVATASGVLGKALSSVGRQNKVFVFPWLHPHSPMDSTLHWGGGEETHIPGGLPHASHLPRSLPVCICPRGLDHVSRDHLSQPTTKACERRATTDIVQRRKLRLEY